MFWDQLLQLIDERRVVPVVGRDLLLLNDGGTLYVRLAHQLAGYLEVSPENLHPGDELNEVVCRFLAAGGLLQDVYSPLKTMVGRESASLPIPPPLLQLASIRPFNLYVTTTFDSLLTRALDQVRFDGETRTRVFAYAPNDVQDLTRGQRVSEIPVVYHVLGKASATPAYAVTQEDMIEFFHGLQSQTHQPGVLLDELRRQSLLILGSRLGDWLTRFLMRISSGQPLSASTRMDYVADGGGNTDPNLVLFLRHFSRGTKVYTAGNAIEFVNELHQRWTGRDHRTDEPPGVATAENPDVPGAIFLSYASEDRKAAENIKNALELAGMDVFFDRDDLKGGDLFEARIRRSLRQCALFIPVISRSTLTSSRRFFRKEWNLALEEAQMAPFSDQDEFLMPVVIDDTQPHAPGIPERFSATQWHSLPDGRPSPEFVARAQGLYRRYQKSHASVS